jgi:phosphatidate cytidylyltransferase
MVKRGISSVFLIIFTVLAVIYKPLGFAAVTVLIMLGLWEFFSMLENKEVKFFKIFGLILGFLIPVSVFRQFPITREWQLFLIVISLFLLFLLELTRKDSHQTILSLSGTVFGVIYIGWCFSFILRIRNLPDGMVLLGFLLVVVKAHDLGAYLVGSFFGKTPLLKRVSPKKSREGFVGGLFFSLIFAFLFKGFLPDFTLRQVLALGFILAVIGQLGDLFESLLKRDCGVKDSGKLIPGMGGILDIIDSLIFTAPVFYFYVTMLRHISVQSLLF